MEMCYDGALVMPSNYAVMDEEEMTYVEGGGTIRVLASASTVREICRAGVALIGAAIGEFMGGPVLAKLVSAALSTLIYDFIIDLCDVTYKGVDEKWSRWFFPTVTFNVDKYV